MRYKGKGEHSVNELEKIIEAQNEQLHQLNSGRIKELEEYKERMAKGYKYLMETDEEAMDVVETLNQFEFTESEFPFERRHKPVN
jgi:uncharacterized protein YPO0396